MRKVILYIAASLDGYIARPDGAVDWLDAYSDADYAYQEFINSVDCAVLGHSTYVKSLSFGEEVFKSMSHYVFTRSGGQDDWGTVRFVREAPKTFIDQLRREPGKDIWMMGGGVLLNDFIAGGLIDEMMIFVIPELLGEGIPLFPGPAMRDDISLVNSVKYANGVVLLHYQKER